MRHLAIVILLLGFAVRPVGATSGTCTTTSVRQTGVGESDFGFPIPSGTGVAMPVEFDEAAGTITMSRDAWYAQFGDTGASFITVGIESFLRMKPGSETGTIEADGTIAFPTFEMAFATSLGSPMPPYTDLPIGDMALTSGVHGGSIPGLSGAKRGSNLDFATGAVNLVGIGIITGAPGTNGPLLTGVEITCTMSPIPTAANLPAGAAFAKVRGKAQVGSAGDKLVLKGTMSTGVAPFDFAGAANSIVNLTLDGATDPLVSVRIAGFTAKGKKFLATRDDTCKIKKAATTGLCKRDGTTVCAAAADCRTVDVVELLAGQKSGAGVVAKIQVSPKAKATTLSLTLAGLDLAALSGGVTTELWVEGRGAIGTATATGDTKKKIK